MSTTTGPPSRTHPVLFHTPTPIISHITSVITSSIPRPPPTSTAIPPSRGLSEWDRFSTGAKAAIVIAAIVGIVVIVLVSMLFCCGCCCGINLLSSTRRRNTAEENGPRDVPLENVGTDAATTAGTPAPRRQSQRLPQDAPPSYEESVPASHQQRAVGAPLHITPAPEEDPSNIVVDGKPPLSEIPFEDVDVNGLGEPSSSASASSSSAARSFHDVHHAGPGDTTGHTSS